MQQKIVFFGSGDYTIPVIEKLLKHGLNLVVTTENNPESRLIAFCIKNKIQTITASSATELIAHYSIFINHSLAILASYGVFVPENITKLFPKGIINIHPSLLPKWKGPSPIQYSLLNSDTQTGVTLIRLDNEIDHGPILSQRIYNLQGNETAKSLLSILFEIGSEMVEKEIIKLENDEKLSETLQDHSSETWSCKIEKKDGLIDMQKIPNKEKLENMIRAYYPWPGVWLITKMKGQELRIKLLPESKIQIEGKNPMNFKDFINGFGEEGKALLTKLNLS